MKLKKINFNQLDVEDIYSASMFILYKLRNIKEYSLISELPYILSKKDLLRFCTYYGGMTIKVPTIKELEKIFKLILLYQYQTENKTKEECRELLELGNKEYEKLLNEIEVIAPILNNYIELNKKYE